MKNNVIEINNLSKYFMDKKTKTSVINNISFSVNSGEFLCIVGTSGCGKTTLLNILSGLCKNYEGNINFNIDKNDIVYMMQEPALFPWLKIKDNAYLGCNIKNINNYDYINFLLKKYGINEFENKYPKEISGGMKQRVALIRTISAKPKLLLLDEPFAALDYQTRLAISDDVYDLVKENNITTIMITHDISEAISLADRVIVLSKRPCHIKNIYDIKLDNKKNPSSNRKDNRFMDYYKLIGEDLDLFEN